MQESSQAVLCSGGLDSAVLLAESARTCARCYPIFIRSGLAWESVELDHLQRFIQSARCFSIQSPVVLDLPVGDLYGPHWSRTGRDVPDAESPDDAVYLPGRNVILLAKSLLWCHLNNVASIALAVLAGNPFPDATPAFFEQMAAVVNRSVGGAVRVETPYSKLTKSEVVLRGRDFPLQHTFSCIDPVNSRHCGRCNKCAERRRAFADSGIEDPTLYSI